MWRFAPFYFALAAAPLLFGGVKAEAQAVLGILLATGLGLTRHEDRGAGLVPRWLTWSLGIFIVLSLVPLPLGLVKMISPERARLAVSFPIGLEIPTWITLSTSPARTVQRLYEMALASAAFILARRSAGAPGGSRRLALTLAGALLLLGCSDIWSREHGRQSVLGLWNISWGKGSGTFANHNHFANWIFVAALFCAGWILHELFRRDRKAHRVELALVALATSFSVIMAFMAASRSGSLALIAGSLLFLTLLRAQFRRRSFALAVSALAITGLVLALLAVEPLLHRVRTVSTESSMAGKLELGRETISLAPRFLIAGVGAGSFVRAYNHYKTGHGDGTFWHAENDWLELFVEYGFPGAILILAALALLGRRAFATESISPLGAGIAGALTVFGVHGLGEFVAHIPANLILAATLLGFAVGRANSAITPARPIWLAVVLLIVSALQGLAWWNSWQAARASAPMPHIQRSLALWPFAVNRHIGEMRAATTPASRANLDQRINQALRLDPLNWELRVEQVWFQLAYATNTARALSNAWLTVRLNPLQGQIPLRYAQHFAARDPELALQFLAAVHPAVAANHEGALAVAWTITRDPAQLWSLTPNTVPGIHNLIHFAQGEKLYTLAAQACQALEGRLAPETLAQYYFEAQRPDQSIRLLQPSTSLPAQILRVKSYVALNRSSEAITALQQLLANPRFHAIAEGSFKPTTSFSLLLTNYQRAPQDPAAALLLAEKTATLPPVDFQLLSNLTRAFPAEPRIAYLLLQSQLTFGQTNAAAQTAAALASRLPEK